MDYRTRLNQYMPDDDINLTIGRQDAQGLVDSIRSLSVPGYRLEGLMLLLTWNLESNHAGEEN